MSADMVRAEAVDNLDISFDKLYTQLQNFGESMRIQAECKTKTFERMLDILKDLQRDLQTPEPPEEVLAYVGQDCDMKHHDCDSKPNTVISFNVLRPIAMKITIEMTYALDRQVKVSTNSSSVPSLATQKLRNIALENSYGDAGRNMGLLLARVKAVQSRPSWASLGRGDLRKGYLIAQRGQSESHSEWADEDVGLQRVGQCYNPTLARCLTYGVKRLQISGYSIKKLSGYELNGSELSCLPTVCQNASMCWLIVIVGARFRKPPAKPPDGVILGKVDVRKEVELPQMCDELNFLTIVLSSNGVHKFLQVMIVDGNFVYDKEKGHKYRALMIKVPANSSLVYYPDTQKLRNIALGTFILKIEKQSMGLIEHAEADYTLVACGSSPQGHKIAEQLGHSIIDPVPSLFTFKVADSQLAELSGVTFPKVKAKLQLQDMKRNIPQLTQVGPMLVTHWGLSGPVILRLSAWGARNLFETEYRSNLIVDFSPDIHLEDLKALLSHREGIDGDILWASVSNNAITAVSSLLKNCSFGVTGKGQFKEEFFTAGGVPLSEISLHTMVSKIQPRLFFAGEVLNIDRVKNLMILLFETAFLNLGFSLSLDDHAILVRYITKFIMFSLPRPPEVGDLEDKVNFKDGEMLRNGILGNLGGLLVIWYNLDMYKTKCKPGNKQGMK
ncbi:unnamed protein product [Rhodiola kirilowii]